MILRRKYSVSYLINTYGENNRSFISNSDNKYAQYFLTKDEWSTSEGDWEKMNLEEDVSQLGQYIDAFPIADKLSIREIFKELYISKATGTTLTS